MELNSTSLESDAIGNLYRSALFMVKGQIDLSISFYQKSSEVLKGKLSTQILNALTKKEILTKEKRFLLAEKILDQYHSLKISQH